MPPSTVRHAPVTQSIDTYLRTLEQAASEDLFQLAILPEGFGRPSC